MKILNKLKKKVKKSIASVMALFTMASVITVPNMTTVVNADSGLDVSTAFQQVVGSHTGKGNWHYSYQGGKNWAIIMGDGDPSADTYYNIGLDCTAGSIAVVARAIKNAGGNPRDYFGMLESSLNNVYPPDMTSLFESNGKWTKVASGYIDSSALQTGDILIYGTVGQAGHMSVYAGNNTTIDFTSGGAGTETYSGYARNDLTYSDGGTSTSGSYSLTAIFRANMSKDVTISLTKTSGNTSITNGLVNAYSLNGAVYGIYSDSSANTQIGTLTTDANGTGTTTVTVDSSTSTLYYKEITAPKGYCLDSTVRPFSFTGTSATVNASDMPGNDPLVIRLSKNNAMTDGEEPASLAGAQFTIKYYDLDSSADYTAEQLANMKATRTWVIETKARTLSTGKTLYVASLDADHLVDGSSELYKTVGGSTTIPVGVITVTETKEPTITYTDENGNEQLVYTLNNKTLDANGNEVLSSNGTVVMKVTGDQNGYNLIGGNDYTIKETPEKGGFYMTKIDDETSKAEPQGNGTLDGAYYEVYNDNDYQVGSAQVAVANKGEKVWSFTTANGGVYSAGLDTLQVGRYIVKEVDPSTGYMVAGTTEQTLIVNKNSQTFLSGDSTFTEQAIRGGFKLQKNDTDTGTYAQGNTNLKATFKIINTSTNPVWVDSNGDGEFSDDEYYANGATIKLPQSYVTVGTANTTDGTFTANEAGYFETITTALPYGSYKIVEVTAPEGFAMDGDSVTETTFDVTENGVLVEKLYDIKNDVFTGKFDIQKMLTSTNNGMSTTMKPEEGVEFTALLKATVDEKFGGDYKAAYEAIFGFAPNVEGNPTPDDSGTIYAEDGSILFTTKEYDVITTNKSGMAYSRDLAYGEYYIFQSSHADSIIDFEGNVADYDGTIFNVTEEHQATKHYYVANHHQLYTLKMTKTSLQTGEKIELTNAKFKIKDSDGNYVTQKIGNKTYDTFSTVTRKMIVDSADGKKINVETGTFVTENPSEDDAGVAYTALGVESGTYYIVEVQTPDGFTQLTDPIEITVKESSITEKDADGTNFVETEVANTQITGTLNIVKSFDLWEDANDTLYDLEETYQQIGFTLTAKEDIINPADGKVLVKAGEQAVRLTGDRSNPYEKVAEIFLDAEGKASVDGLPLGSYTLTETTSPDNVVKSEAYDFTLTQEEGNVVTAVYEDTAEITNEFTKTTFKKTDVASNEIAGAEMSVTDEEGNVVDSWTSEEGKDHNVEGLSIGKTYYLNEDLTPVGMVKASSIAFTVDETGAVSTVTMIDKVYSVSKVDVAGEEVEGAEMTVTDENGEVVDQWVSDGTEHKINNLEEGKTYTISETVVAEGYVKANDITFTVKGADLDGNKEDEHIDVVDKVVTTSKVDMGGNEVAGAEMSVTEKDSDEVIDSWTSDGTKHNIKNLEEDKTYVLHEVVAPEGYVKATDIEFTVTGADENGVKVDQTVDMTDKRVSIDKTDGNGNEVEGAKITITDEDGNTVDEWTSTNEKHYVNNLEEGKTYTWHEDYSEEIFGYYYAEDYTFTVTADGIDQELEMVDKPIDYYIEKIDDKGNAVKGVTLELTDITKNDKGEYVNADEEGNPAKVELPNGGVTTGEPFHLVNKLLAGHTYALDETEITAGVYKTNRIEFTVDKYNPATDEAITITMVDASTAVSVRKVDENGNAVAGAKMQIIETTTDEEGNVVAAKNEDGTDKVVYEFTTTDAEEGTDVSDKVVGGETYILREDEAPFGFDAVEDRTFTVTGEAGVYQVLVVKDNHSKEYITAEKVDSSDTSKKLAGAELELYNAKTNKLVAKGTTGSDGTVTWEVKWNDDNGGYYIKETKAPTGYKKTDDKFTVAKATEETGFTKDAAVVVTIKNDKDKSLGVSIPLVAGGMMIIALAGLYIVISRKKETETSK